MTTAVVERDDTAILEQVLVNGDLSKLSGHDRLAYYRKVCESLGLNPLTKPFDYITLNGKLTLYANRTCTEQLREKREVSTVLTDKRFEEGLYIVTAKATLPNGRTDESTGAVPIDKLTGEARANAIMKAETKAKRRVTLSIVGLGWLDESEVDSIADARRVRVNQGGEIVEPEHYVQRGSIPPPSDQEGPELDQERDGAIGAEKAKVLESRILGAGLTVDDINNEMDARGWETLAGLTRSEADTLWREMWKQRPR